MKPENFNYHDLEEALNQAIAFNYDHIYRHHYCQELGLITADGCWYDYVAFYDKNNEPNVQAIPNYEEL